MPGPLTGTRIIDTSERSPAAAITGMILSDYGAEVIHAEPPGGDPLRGIPGSRVWLRGQKSVVVGPAEIADGSWARLRASADVVLATAHGGADRPHPLLKRWQPADHQILSVLTARPRPAGQVGAGGAAGPPAYGELIEAEFGCMHLQEGHREGPIFLGWPHAVYGGAWLLQIGILAALYEREQSGRGQVLTTSLLDGLAILNPNRWIGGPAIEGERFTRGAIGRRGNRKHVVAIFECSDGRWIHVHTGPRGAFDRLLHLIGRDDLVDDGTRPEVRGDSLPPALADDFWDHLHKTLKSRPAQHWVDLFNAHDVACMPVVLAGEALKLEQTRANGMVATTPDGRTELGIVTKFGRTPAAAGVGVPEPGEHNAVLLARPPALPRKRARDRAGAPAGSRGPLAGLTVLDLGNVLAAPFSARLLADLGARVIKVEEVAGPAGRVDQWVLRLTTERGKECIGLNLKAPEGRQILYDLVRQADALVTNMRMGALERLGIDDAALRQINPRLVYCHSAGYGTAGPWAKLPAFGVLHTALSGVMDRSAGRGNPPLHALASLDYASGLTTAVSMLAALLERERSGLGQFLEVIQLGSAGLLAMSDVYFEGDRMSDSYALDPEQRGPAPTNVLYRTRDGWIVLACYADDEWQRVPSALALDITGWPRYAEARREPLDASAAGKAIAGALISLPAAEAQRRLDEASVPCAVPRPYEADELVDEIDLRGLGVIEVVTHPEVGPMFEVGQTIRFTRTAPPQNAPAHRHAQDTRSVTRALGRSDAEIAAWAEAKIVAAGAGR